jgi:hypothetical protein
MKDALQLSTAVFMVLTSLSVHRAAAEALLRATNQYDMLTAMSDQVNGITEQMFIQMQAPEQLRPTTPLVTAPQNKMA